MRLFSLIFTLIHLLFILSGCLDTSQSSSSSVVSYPVSPDFPGAQKAVNLAGPSRGSIRVEWRSATAADVTGYNIYQIEPKTGALSILAKVDASVTTYVHSDLDLNKAYSYIVRYLNSVGNEDQNKVIVSSIAYVGMNDPIYSFVETIDQTTLKAYLKPTTGDFNEVRIYAAPLRDPTNLKLITTVPSGVDHAILTGLRTGMTYRVIARAYSSTLRAEDGNNIEKTATTLSEAFGNHRDTVRVYKYRGFSSIQAYGDAPNAPAVKTPNAAPYSPNNSIWNIASDKVANPAYTPLTPVYQPREAQVRLTWLPFQGADRSTKYKVVRVKATGLNGNTFSRPDFTTEVACSAAVNTSCVVCDDGDLSVTNNCEIASSANPGSAFKSAFDPNVAKPGIGTVANPSSEVHYFYSVTAYKTTGTGLCPQDCWYEEFDTTDDNDYKKFAVKVSIPPVNMALVQRDAVNYETCELMGRQSDPLNNQRCLFSGMGSKPIDSGKISTLSATQIPDGFYDFGYNLFYDRWEVGCQWTRGTGKCSGANSNTALGCFGDGTFSNPNTNRTGNVAGPVSGVDGDVLFIPSYRSHQIVQACYAYVSAKPVGQKWVQLRWNAGTPVSNPTLTAALSPDPRNMDVPPMDSVLTPKMGGDVCNAAGTVYGSKRLPRLREFRAAAGWQRLPGDEFASVGLAERKLPLNFREVALFEANNYQNNFTPSNPSYIPPVYNACNNNQRGIRASAWNPYRKTFINGSSSEAAPGGMAPSSGSFQNGGGVDFSSNVVKGTPGSIRTIAHMLDVTLNWEGVAGFTAPQPSYYGVSAGPNDLFMYGDSMMIGSTGTSNCTSRFGIQDLYGNAPEVLSDQVGCTGDGICRPWSSNMIDAKNTDLSVANYSWNGVRGPRATDAAGTTCPAANPALATFSQVAYSASTITYNSGPAGSTVNYFSIPLGLPLVSNTEFDGVDNLNNKNAVPFSFYVDPVTAPNAGRLGHFIQKTHCAVGVSGETTATLPMNIFAGGKYMTSGMGASPETHTGAPGRYGLGFTPYGSDRSYLGFRCAQPAD